MLLDAGIYEYTNNNTSQIKSFIELTGNSIVGVFLNSDYFDHMVLGNNLLIILMRKEMI